MGTGARYRLAQRNRKNSNFLLVIVGFLPGLWEGVFPLSRGGNLQTNEKPLLSKSQATECVRHMQLVQSGFDP